MLQNLHVKNLALIKEIEVDFTKGLNILTGETGAGKSIILGSINLALGGKYSGDFLRKGAEYGLVELSFHVEHPQTLEKLKELGIVPEEGQVIITRRLMDGRSISRINGETVTLARLKEVSQALIDIHGQHEHQSLLHKKNHRQIVDDFAHVEEQTKQVKEAYLIYQSLRAELEQSQCDEAERKKEAAFLEFEINEIKNANLSETEEENIEETYRLMNHAKKIVDDLEEAYAYMSGGNAETITELVSRTVRCLAGSEKFTDRTGNLYRQALDIESIVGDFAKDLHDYIEELQFSPEEFYQIESRLNEINHLKSKYGNTVEQILDYLQQQEERLEKLENYDSYLQELNRKLHTAEKQLEEACEQLSKKRKQEAEILQNVIQDGLLDLNFLDVQFEIHFEKMQSYSALGFDDIEFLISMNPGQPLLPLSEIASGGELSRIMLAIKAAFADKDQIETLIFDEIDVGISGRTAQKVSEKMAIIGKNHQVICITHLAQIAAMADSHFLIEKSASSQDTITSIRKLTEEEMIEELARILGGVQITEAVKMNAKEMKILAEGLKK